MPPNSFQAYILESICLLLSICLQVKSWSWESRPSRSAYHIKIINTGTHCVREQAGPRGQKAVSRPLGSVVSCLLVNIDQWRTASL